jgi:hypothetical protein
MPATSLISSNKNSTFNMGHNRKEGKPPLYRKVNKRTHNGRGWYVIGKKERYRYERGKKQDILPEHQSIKRHNPIRTGYDYTPLIKFLHAHVGQSWDVIYQECVSRLDSPKPLTWMVGNINERGLVVDKHPGGDLGKWCCVGGEESYWSALWVDEDGQLQFVDKDFSIMDIYKEDWESRYSGEWTVSWNGKIVWPADTITEEKE